MSRFKDRRRAITGAMQTQVLRRNARRRAGLGALACSALALGCETVPEASFTADGALRTSEQGASVGVSVALARAPFEPVIIQAISDDETEGRASEGVRFDRDNWRTPQVITISGVDDDERDGDTDYDVRFTSREADRPSSEGVVVATLRFTNRDDDRARFALLGDLLGGENASYANDVSDSGEVVVGYSGGPGGDQAVGWTADGGLYGLGGPESRAVGVSPNGLLITGSVYYPDSQRERAGVIWRPRMPFEILYGAPGPDGRPSDLLVVEGSVVLDDGRVFGTCYQYGAYRDPFGCRVDGPGLVDWAWLGSSIFAVDSLGHSAGSQRSERHAPLSSGAVLHGSGIPYPPGGELCVAGHHCEAAARAFSADGEIAVGTSRIPKPGDTAAPTQLTLYDTAFVYTTAEGTQLLPDLEGGAEAGGAYDISADGQLIAGFGSDVNGKQAVVWLARTPRLLAELVREADGELPDGYLMREVRAMSRDGRTLVGNGENARGEPEAFSVVLPRAE